MKRESIMKGLGAHGEDKSPSSRTLGSSPFVNVRAQQGLHRDTLTHALSQAYTLAPFFSQ